MLYAEESIMVSNQQHGSDYDSLPCFLPAEDISVAQSRTLVYV